MIPSTMILVGSLLILGLAGYWMRRAVKAERRLAKLKYDVIDTAVFYERLRQKDRASAEAAEQELRDDLAGYIKRCIRIATLWTPNMAHVGKKAVAIARGER